jgi:hypothetical protein
VERFSAGVWQLGSPDLATDTQVAEVRSALLSSADDGASGLALTGTTGRGKSAVAGRVLRELQGDGWAAAVHIGRWYPLGLFAAVAEALDHAPAAFPRRREAIELLRTPGSEEPKLETVCELLAHTPLVLLFDDVGQNFTIDGGFVDPGFAYLFDRICAAARRGRVMATCRCPMPEGARRLMPFVLQPARTRDAWELASRLPSLGQIGKDSRASLVALLRGHPRLLVLADAWLAVGPPDLQGAYLDLLGAVAPASRAGGKEPDPARQRASILDLHVRLLRPRVRDMLLQAAVSTFPLTARDLVAACDRRTLAPQERRSPDVADVAAAIDDSHRLLALGLATSARADELYVEAWIADGLRGYQGGEWVDRHERAILMHYAEMNGPRTTFDDIIAITRHLAAVGGYADLVRFTLDVIEAGSGTLSACALLGEVVPAVPVDQPDRRRLVDRQVALLRDIGLPVAAQHVSDRYQ